MTDIAIFIPSLRGGGTEKMMLNLASELAARGWRVDLVLVQAEGSYLPDVPPAVRVVDLGARRVLGAWLPLVRYLRHSKPRVLLSAMNHVNLVALWARRLARVPTRLVISERTHITLDVQHRLFKRQLIIPLLIRLFYGWADAVVAVSAGVRDDLLQVARLPAERVQVIYNPVVTPQLRTLAEAPTPHPWLTENRVVLGVGRLTRAKDFPTLIRAFALAHAQHPDLRLMILGEGEDRPSLQSLIHELGLGAVVALPGFSNNPYAYMRHAALFVLSSIHEGFPNVLAEALACGCAVVSTDCPSGPREILMDGAVGRLVSPGDVAGLAAAILATLDAPPEAAQLATRAAAFAQVQIVDQYAAVLLPDSQ